MRIILNEIIFWIEAFRSYISGKIGTLLRMVWCRYRWEKVSNVSVRTLSQFISPQNILFSNGVSLGKNAFFSADGSMIEIDKNFSCNTNCHLNA